MAGPPPRRPDYTEARIYARSVWTNLNRNNPVPRPPWGWDLAQDLQEALQGAAYDLVGAEGVRDFIDRFYSARGAPAAGQSPPPPPRPARPPSPPRPPPPAALAEAREALAALPPEAAHALNQGPGEADLLSQMLQGQGEFSAAHPSAIPPPAAALSAAELKYLEKLAGGPAEGADLLKRLQEQGAVVGPATPFAPLPLPVPPAPAPPLPPVPTPTPPPAAPGPAGVPPSPGSLGPARERGTPPAVAWRELAGLAEGPLTGPTGDVDPGGAAPARGNIPWDVLAGLGHETSEKLPWDVLAGLAGGPSAEELAGEADRKTEAARTPARVSPFRHPLQYLGQAGQRFVEETLGFDLGLGGDEPPGGEAALPGPLAGIPRAPAFGAGPGEAASAEPAGAGGASLVPLLERIAAGVERLVEIMGQAQEQGGASFGGRPGRPPAGDDFGYDDDPFTPASPSEDLEALPRPGKTQDAFGRPEPEAPKRQRRAAAEEL